MKKSILIVVLIFVVVVVVISIYFLWKHHHNHSHPSPTQTSIITPLEKSFRDEIIIWTNKSNTTSDRFKSSIYRSYAMANLYFLEPYISIQEYNSLFSNIEGTTPQISRYIDPKIVLSIVT